MTTPRGSYGGGSGSYYPSSASFPDTPIYDSLVAERGTPQIAPIRVPAPYPSYDTGSFNAFGNSGNMPMRPALPALPALPSGPSAQPSYGQPQPVQNGYPAQGYPQPATPYTPQPAPAPRPAAYGGGWNGGGQPTQNPQHPSPSGYDTARPVPPRPMAPRQMPGGHPEDLYQRRNLGAGVPPQQQHGGGYYQG
ncbi:DUF6643 family protein [Actinacidiphila yeochonensis]|uniref:DUF6643 family protein n=1 Tax=Actinacidiphila yeochonensis TaxID=89050 RepID=UPI000565BD43|nr:DUF6643 family protein [Actinacidiphila yeochonensis]